MSKAKRRKRFVGSPDDVVFSPSKVSNASAQTAEEVANKIADALDAHEFNNWYHALLTAAIQETGNVDQGIQVANEVYAKNPHGGDNIGERDDDAEAILGGKK